MEAAAQAAGRVLMEGFMYRFHPQHALVKDLIATAPSDACSCSNPTSTTSWRIRTTFA